MQMRGVVRVLARQFPTAIISGRGREKVENFVQLKELYYAGSHGMDIAGPKVWCGDDGRRGDPLDGHDRTHGVMMNAWDGFTQPDTLPYIANYQLQKGCSSSG